jgi:hypothetical protein
MNYQPPLIGTKQLLNFRATSIPAPGGYALIVSLGLGMLAVILDWRRPQAARVAAPERARAAVVL